MKKLNLLLFLLGLVSWTACDVEEEVVGDNILTKNNKQKLGILDASSIDPINEVCGEPGTTTLLAGQFTDVGDLRVSIDGSFLVVEYLVDGDHTLLDTHLEVVENFEDFPMTPNGNPKNGHFTYSGQSSYSIDLNQFSSDNLLIAAHGVVVNHQGDIVDLEFFAECIPAGLLSYQVLQNRPDGDPSYFSINLPAFGIENGVGWCLDVENTIGGYPEFKEYQMEAISSYSDDLTTLECLVDKPENLDIINYLCNQDFSDNPLITGSVIQGALWTIIDDNPPTNGGGGISWDQELVDNLVASAFEHGEGFIPGCEDKVVVIMDPGCPEDPNHNHLQTTFVCVPNKCPGGDDTIWGQGTDFPGNNWAMFFKYCVSAPAAI